MTTLEVCEICDIAECSHIKARRASIDALSQYVKTYQWSMSGWRGGPVVLTTPPPSFDGILKQFVKPRQSTLRIRKIRWKSGLRYGEIARITAALASKGAVVKSRNWFVLNGHWYGAETTVTWPESKQ